MALVDVDYYAPSGAAATLSGLSLAVNHGEFFAVLGADGAARTAVALLATGLVEPDRGSVVSAAGTRGRAGDVGLVFSAPGQGLIAATVLEEVRAGLEWQERPEQEIASRSEAVLRRFRLWEQRHQSPATLSGGEKQRLAMAAALAIGPSCLVLDEPAAMLDPTGVAMAVSAAREIAAAGCGVLWLTSDPAQALAADRAAILAAGRLVWSGDPAVLLGMDRELRDWGLPPLPQSVLARSLTRRGLSMPGVPAAPEALVEEICSVWPKFASRTNKI